MYVRVWSMVFNRLACLVLVLHRVAVYLGTVGKQYDPNAILFRWAFREDDNLPRLIGTDPALADRSKFFRWIDEPGGWERREPWPQGAVNVEVANNGFGTASKWPGAVPLPPRPRGRPPKEYAEKDDRPVTMSFSVRRADLFEIQQRASVERKTVSEWLTSVVCTALASSSNEDVTVSRGDEDVTPCVPQRCSVDDR